MKIWRGLTALGLGFLVVCGLSACGSAAFQLDALTPAEPSATRERAMRRLRLATAYFEQNQTQVAQQEVRAALQIDPQFAQAYSLLGLIHQRDQVPALAQPSFEQALQLASQPPVRADEWAAIAHNYAWFLCEQNRFSQAQALFDRALSQPGYAHADKTAQAVALCKDRAMAHAKANPNTP